MKYIRLFEDFQLGDLNVMSSEEIKGLFFEECRKSTPDLELIRVIIENGLVDVGAKGEWDYTPLHWAVSGDNIELAKLLIASGADVNVKRWDGFTPLHRAVSRDNMEVTKLLIGSGADVNAKDSDDDTPLHEAVGRDNIELAKFLIDSGAWVNAKNKDGETPLHRAQSEEMKALLKQHGATL